MTPLRKPENVPRRVIRVGIPETEKVETWVSFNNLLAGDRTLAEESARTLRAAPKWFQRCGVHANMDPVLGRYSWEEDISICIRFRQTERRVLQHVDRTTMWFNTCAMQTSYKRYADRTMYTLRFKISNVYVT
jgi:hypothetical protein